MAPFEPFGVPLSIALCVLCRRDIRLRSAGNALKNRLYRFFGGISAAVIMDADMGVANELFLNDSHHNTPSPSVYARLAEIDQTIMVCSPPREGLKEDSKQKVAPTLRRTTKREPKNSSSAPVGNTT